ncbi:MAG TPA: pilin [Candidatus Saccharimonadales bacterium]|jgi:hypothetical protein
MKKFLSSILLALAIVTGSGMVATPAYAADATSEAIKQACQGVAGQTGSNCGTGAPSINRTIKTIVNLLSVIGGVAAVIMIVVGGFKYIVSGGEAQSVAGAKRTIIYAVVGLVVIALSQFIVRYVLKEL